MSLRTCTAMTFITPIRFVALAVLIQLQLLGRVHGDPLKRIFINSFHWDSHFRWLSLFCGTDKSNDFIETLQTADHIEDNLDYVEFSEVHRLLFRSCDFEQLPDRVLAQFTELRNISIYQCAVTALRVEDLPPHRSHLDELIFGSTPIGRIDTGLLEAIPQLKSLRIEDTKIAAVAHELASAPNLETIYIGHSSTMQIDREAFKGLRKLKELTIRYNELRGFKFDFDSDNIIEKLDLHGNEISVLNVGDFRRLSHLRELDLGSNKLSAIELGTFAPLANLEKLTLAYNKLANLDFRAFLPSMKSLTVLDLDSNNLNKLSDDFDRLFPRLDRLWITRNKFGCSYLKQFLRTLRLRPHVVDASGFYHFRSNVRGIYCDEDDEATEQTGETKGAERGFKSGYNVWMFVVVLAIGLGNLVICAAIVVIGRRIASARAE